MPKQGDNWGTIAAPSACVLPHAKSASCDVTAKSPRDHLEAAIAAGPLSPAERSTFRSQLVAVIAHDEARRAAPSPQTALNLDQAA